MAAWALAPDRMNLGDRLKAQLHRRAGGKLHGLDHPSLYTGQDDQRVIVCQPYGIEAADLAAALALAKLRPEVIQADEWAFYYPGRARLFVIKFPKGYAAALAKME